MVSSTTINSYLLRAHNNNKTRATRKRRREELARGVKMGCRSDENRKRSLAGGRSGSHSPAQVSYVLRAPTILRSSHALALSRSLSLLHLAGDKYASLEFLDRRRVATRTSFASLLFSLFSSSSSSSFYLF